MTTLAQSEQRKKTFLTHFARTGNVSRSARAAKVARNTPSHWCKADPDFAAAYAEAELQATDALVDAAWKRAMQGVKKQRGVYDRNGKLVATEEEIDYSDSLLMFLIKKRDPSYREHYDHTLHGMGGGPMQFVLEVVTVADRAPIALDAHPDPALPDAAGFHDR